MANIAQVGTATLGAGLWGQLDFAGNMYQWNLDWYATYVEPCTDCAYVTAANGRVNRGGDFSTGESALLPAYRVYGIPSNRSFDIGFRCARSP